MSRAEVSRLEERFRSWVNALEERHLADLSRAELRRGLQALSTWYVEKRVERGRGKALDGAGKRAAFALFYGALHFRTTQLIVEQLGAAEPAPARLLDLGCGTGAAGAAWALQSSRTPAMTAVDRHPWALEETRWTWSRLGLRGRRVRGDLTRSELPGRGGAILLAYALNELSADERAAMRPRLLDAHRRGARILIVEPISRRISPWWNDWSTEFVKRGGRNDEWRFPANLPQPITDLDQAAGLNHRELTARTLWL